MCICSTGSERMLSWKPKKTLSLVPRNCHSRKQKKKNFRTPKLLFRLRLEVMWRLSHLESYGTQLLKRVARAKMPGHHSFLGLKILGTFEISGDNIIIIKVDFHRPSAGYIIETSAIRACYASSSVWFVKCLIENFVHFRLEFNVLEFD